MMALPINVREVRVQCPKTWAFLVSALMVFLVTNGIYKDGVLLSPECGKIDVHVLDNVRKFEGNDSKWVILHTYMRGGSTFLGSIFDQNKDAFYWFEPILSAYHSMLATYLVEPLEITNTKRGMSEFEEKYIKSALTHLQECNFEELPAQFVMNKFLWALETEKEYFKCLGHKTLYRMEQCSNYLGFYCQPSNPALSLQRNCHVLMSKSLGNNLTYIDLTGTIPGVAADLLNIPEVNYYQKCTQPLVELHKQCLSHLIPFCKQAKLHVYKVIRSTPKLSIDMYNMHHDSYIIYQVRDPRGILTSRLRNGCMTYKLPSEAKNLCQKMLRDYRYFTNLQKQKNFRILIIRYEDVVSRILEYLEVIYRFIGEPLPDYLREKVKNSIHAKVFRESFLNTLRRNGTKTAHAWRKSLSPRQKNIIDFACSDFLKEAGYKL